MLTPNTVEYYLQRFTVNIYISPKLCTKTSEIEQFVKSLGVLYTNTIIIGYNREHNCIDLHELAEQEEPSYGIIFYCNGDIDVSKLKHYAVCNVDDEKITLNAKGAIATSIVCFEDICSYIIKDLSEDLTSFYFEAFQKDDPFLSILQIDENFELSLRNLYIDFSPCRL